MYYNNDTRNFFHGDEKMKLLLAFLLMITFTVNAEIPFIPEVDDRLDTLEGMTGDISLSKAAGYGGAVTSAIGSGKIDADNLATAAVTAVKIEDMSGTATGLYGLKGFSVEFTASGAVAGDYNSGVTVPANAIIEKVILENLIVTVSASDMTTALVCDTHSLIAAVNLTDKATGYRSISTTSSG